MSNCFDSYQVQIDNWSQRQNAKEDFKVEWLKAIKESRSIAKEMAISESTLTKVIGL